jgi:hypothetical protein
MGAMRELLDRSLGDHVQVEFDFSETLWPVEVDPGQFDLVVLNLAVNARDAMPNSGTMIVRGENLPDFEDKDLKGDYVRLSVIDTGIGMEPEIQARVFEPYFTTKDVGKGSGLGLPQVYGFATQSHGIVRIDSNVGRGTCIALYLPKSTRPLSGDQGTVRSLHTDGQQGHDIGRVRLVEDDDEVAALTSEMLGQLGYDVTRTANAAALLGALANGRHDRGVTWAKHVVQRNRTPIFNDARELSKNEARWIDVDTNIVLKFHAALLQQDCRFPTR